MANTKYYRLGKLEKPQAQSYKPVLNLVSDLPPELILPI